MLSIPGTRSQRLTAGSMLSVCGFTALGQDATSAPKVGRAYHVINEWTPKQEAGLSK